MGDFALRVNELSKEYRIGQLHSGRTLLRERAARLIRRGVRAAGANTSFWALRGVSFDVEVGDVVGIIGENGAGKSTLLKILSRITEPTSGFADVRGRVGSLLEVGTGFHQELTGRENVFLNGAILGMSRTEIAQRFDEIVEFAGVAEFIDTPVKRYSSGMYVRLAFAVAAHLEPDVLIIDEVLSVGDAAFQKRSIGKMGEVAREGRTVLFVSHNMQSVRALCDRAILLESGRIVADGGTESVVRRYLALDGDQPTRRTWSDPATQPGDDQCRLVDVRVTDAAGEPGPTFRSSEPLQVSIEIDLRFTHPTFTVGFALVSADGSTAFQTYHTDTPDDERPVLVPGRHVLTCTIPSGLLNMGRYSVTVLVGLHYLRWIAKVESAVEFEVVFDHGSSPLFNAERRSGAVAPALPWSLTDSVPSKIAAR